MKRPTRARRPRETPVLTPAEEAHVQALTVAMALAPGVYTRNRMFDFFASAAVRRAKARAAVLRGIVKHLTRATDMRLDQDAETPESTTACAFVLRYGMPVVSLSRVVELSRVELATLRVLAAQATATASLPSASWLAVEAMDRALIETSLASLMALPGNAGPLARAAQDRASGS